MTQPRSIKTVACADFDPVQRVDARLGRHVEHDIRSKGFPARSLPGGLKSRLWNHDAPILDQGELGCCTGTAITQLLNCSVMHWARKAVHGDNDYLTLDTAIALYHRATQVDPFDGEYPPEDTGSSGLAVAKAATEAGYGVEYRHIFGFQHLLSAAPMTPLIVGTWWYSGMSRLDSKQRAHPTGRQLGGHEYLLLGTDFRNEEFTFLNSWGPTFGRRGRFYMSFTEFEELLLDDGDATQLVGATPKALNPEAALHAAPDDKDAL